MTKLNIHAALLFAAILPALLVTSCARANDAAVTATKSEFDVAKATPERGSKFRTLIEHMDTLAQNAVAGDISDYVTGGTQVSRISGDELFVRQAVSAQESIYTIFIAPKNSYAGNLGSVALCTVRIDPAKIISGGVVDHRLIALDTAFNGGCDADAPASAENDKYYALFAAPVAGRYNSYGPKEFDTKAHGKVSVRIIERADKSFDREDALKFATTDDGIRQMVSYPDDARWTGHAILESGDIMQYDSGRISDYGNSICIYSGDNLPLTDLADNPAAIYCEQERERLEKIRLDAFHKYLEKNPPKLKMEPFPNIP